MHSNKPFKNSDKSGFGRFFVFIGNGGSEDGSVRFSVIDFASMFFRRQGDANGRLTGKKVNGLIRVSILRNYPVICNHRQIGLMQGVSLNEAQNQVRALIVSCGIRGKKLILPKDIVAFGEGFILVDKASIYARSYESSPSVFVRDTTGLLCGRVTDYAMNESTLEIEAVEMIPGYIGRERRFRVWVYAYVPAEHRNLELVIPACIGNELRLKREGNEACAYRP